MIDTQVIKENNSPVAVILDYKEYLRLKDIEQDTLDYENTIKIRDSNPKWTSHKDLKKELKL